MFKLTVCVKRREGMSHEEFQRCWLKHGNLFRRFAAYYGIVRYVQSHTLSTTMNKLMKTSRGFARKYDGVGEIWWKSEEDFRRVAASPIASKLREMFAADERTFMDPARSSGFFTQEYVFVGCNLALPGIPEGCICPITRMVMEDPVMTSEGYTYEREAITRWLEKFRVNPITFEPLSSTVLIPNLAIKSVIITLVNASTVEREEEDKALSSMWVDAENEARAEVVKRGRPSSPYMLFGGRDSSREKPISYLEKRLRDLEEKLLITYSGAGDKVSPITELTSGKTGVGEPLRSSSLSGWK